MNQKQIDFVYVGRRWNHAEPHSTQAQMLMYSKQLKDQGFVCNILEDNVLPTAPVLVLYGGFPGPGGTNEIRTRTLTLDAQCRGAFVIFWTVDMETLKTYWKHFKKHDIQHGLVTSFKKPWMMWKATYQFHDFLTPCPIRVIREPPQNQQPKFKCGYVGWPKPWRKMMLESIDYSDMVLIGWGGDKQSRYPYICTGYYTPYPYLWELYCNIAWAVCVSDKDHIKLQSAPSRMSEAWRCKRPCAIHQSIVDSRPELDWSKIEDYIFCDAKGLHEICKIGMNPDGSYNLKTLEAIADLQRLTIGLQYYPDNLPHSSIKWMNEKVFPQEIL